MPYSAIKLVSFDLDNTLYDNQPIIKLAEQKSQEYLRVEFNRQDQVFDYQLFIEYRKELLLSEKSLSDGEKSQYENLSFLRECVLLKCCENLSNPKEVAKQALEIFLTYRNQVVIEPQVTAMLQQLAQRYHLVSVTNGNCNPAKLSIFDVFKKNYSPASGYRAKPHPQMLKQILIDFKLRPEQILHVGDRLDSDGLAAEAIGCPFYFFAPFAGEIDIGQSCDKFVAKLQS